MSDLNNIKLYKVMRKTAYSAYKHESDIRLHLITSSNNKSDLTFDK